MYQVFIFAVLLRSWCSGDPVLVNTSPTSADATNGPDASTVTDTADGHQQNHSTGMTSDQTDVTFSHLTDLAHNSSVSLLETYSSVKLNSGSIDQSTTSSNTMDTTDASQFPVLVGISCKWQDGNGIEKQLRACQHDSSCDLGPVSIRRQTGPVDLYFCKDSQHLLISMACRLEDKERVLVLPKCLRGSTCNVGPLVLTYRGKQVQVYFCDSQAVPTQRSRLAHPENGAPNQNSGTSSNRDLRLDKNNDEDDTDHNKKTDENTDNGEDNVRGDLNSEKTRANDERSTSSYQDEMTTSDTTLVQDSTQKRVHGTAR